MLIFINKHVVGSAYQVFSVGLKKVIKHLNESIFKHLQQLLNIVRNFCEKNNGGSFQECHSDYVNHESYFSIVVELNSPSNEGYCFN